MKEENRNLYSGYGGKAFFPLLVFVALYLGFGLYFYGRGEKSPFNFVPREAALVFGIVFALLMGKGKFTDRVNDFTFNAANPNILLMCLIFILAGIFSAISKASGGVDAVVHAGLWFFPHEFIVPGLFIISCLISISMGTSFGTVSAVAPIAAGFSELGGFNMPMVLSAVLGGAMFGDNLSFISDTTIAATKGAGCEMKEKFKMNFFIALPAALLAILLYTYVGGTGTIDLPSHQSTLSWIKIIPYMAVLVLAFCGLDVIYVLGLGILASIIVGIMSGTLDWFSICANIKKGVSSMYAICFMSIVLKGIIGRVQTMGGLVWLIKKATNKIKGRKGAQYFIAFFTCILDFCVGSNTVCILICVDVLKPLAKKFKIAPKRFASLLDIFACIIPGISPIGINVMAAMTYGGITNPFQLIRFQFYLFALACMALLTIQFDFLKTKEEKQEVDFYPELDNYNL